MSTNEQRLGLAKRIGDAFEPHPEDIEPDLVVGRRAELIEVLQALQTQNAFPVIHGESGVGKTLLIACVERAALGQAEMLDALDASRYGMPAEERYETFRVSLDGVGRSPTDELSATFRKWLVDEGCTPRSDPGTVFDLAAQVTEVCGRRIMVFIDNLGPAERTEELGHLLREAIRSNPDELRFVLASSVFPIASLFSRQVRSMAPSLVYVEVSRMLENEVIAMIDKRLSRLGGDLRVPRQVVRSVAAIARGNRLVAVQLLRESALAAERKGLGTVARRHLDLAAGDLIARLRNVV